MASKFISMRNLKFYLYEMFDAEGLLKLPAFQDHSREIFDLALDTGMRLARELLYPCFAEMDRKPPEFEAGVVKVHPSVRTILRELGDGGWIGAHATYDQGGQQMPNTVMSAFRATLMAANYSGAVYPFLSTGAAHLLLSFASPELIETYVPNMFAGRWQGTMALTEPQAGSSLTDLTTTAVPTEHGYYLMKGQKIFISAAEHDGADNVVNLLLARIEGAPPGIKGVSLFVAPKLRPAEGGRLESNDIVCTGIYHKMGYKGSPITQLALGENGDCRGWLVGAPHKGIRCMFQMMNEARIDVGMAAAAIASAGYYASLEYAKERMQGRKIMEKDPSRPQIPIINHADVKRMLLFQRAVVEGSFALLFQCAKYVDLVHGGDPDKEKWEDLLEILTPVAKSYPSEMGCLSVSAGMQCLGGYGYCDEFPLEQLYRDIRIHPIHEGTTGIQGMDLLGRKVVMKEGKVFLGYLAEVGAAIAAARATGDAYLVRYAKALEEALERLTAVTGHLTGLALKGRIELFLADATLYLEFFGVIAVAWQWLLQALVAHKALADKPSSADLNFYEGKLRTFHFFFEYELPKTLGLAARLMSSDGLTLAVTADQFED